jgi:hypothetical protein
VIQFSVQSTFEEHPLILSGSVVIPRAGLPPTSPTGTVPSETSQAVTAISLGSESIARMTSTATLQPGQTSAAKAQTTVVFGGPIQGVRNAQFTVTAGHLTGTVDNRKFVPQIHRLTALSEQPRMADNGSVPKITIPSGLAQAIRALETSAQQRIKTCQRLTSRVARPTPLALTKPSANAIEVGPPFGLAEGGATSLACENCNGTCDEADATCVAIALATCIFDFGISCVGLPGCYAGDQICENGCYSVDGACCKIQCGPSPGQCWGSYLRQPVLQEWRGLL